jgi:hypothetical protein
VYCIVCCLFVGYRRGDNTHTSKQTSVVGLDIYYVCWSMNVQSSVECCQYDKIIKRWYVVTFLLNSLWIIQPSPQSSSGRGGKQRHQIKQKEGVTRKRQHGRWDFLDTTRYQVLYNKVLRLLSSSAYSSYSS